MANPSTLLNSLPVPSFAAGLPTAAFVNASLPMRSPKQATAVPMPAIPSLKFAKATTPIYPVPTSGVAPSAISIALASAQRVRASVQASAKLNGRPKTHECEWPGCNVSFAEERALNIHRITHKGEKAPVKPNCPVFQCSSLDCGAEFDSAQLLEDHLKNHGNAKVEQFLCPETDCGAIFTNKLQLQVHVAVHKGLDPAKSSVPPVALPVHKCYWVGCAAFFETPQLLINHCEVHNSENKWNYKCTYAGCNTSYKRPGHLTQHVTHCHKEIKIEPKVEGKASPNDAKPSDPKKEVQAQARSNYSNWHKCKVAGCKAAFPELQGLAVHAVMAHQKHKPASPVVQPPPRPRPERKRGGRPRLADILPAPGVVPEGGDEALTECPLCRMRVPSLPQHVKAVHNKIPSLATGAQAPADGSVECQISGCGAVYRTLANLKAHMDLEHAGAAQGVRSPHGFRHKAGIGGSTARPQGDVANSPLLDNAQQTHPCGFPGCQAVYARWLNLDKHCKKMHGTGANAEDMALAISRKRPLESTLGSPSLQSLKRFKSGSRILPSHATDKQLHLDASQLAQKLMTQAQSRMEAGGGAQSSSMLAEVVQLKQKLELLESRANLRGWAERELEKQVLDARAEVIEMKMLVGQADKDRMHTEKEKAALMANVRKWAEEAVHVEVGKVRREEGAKLAVFQERCRQLESEKLTLAETARQLKGQITVAFQLLKAEQASKLAAVQQAEKATTLAKRAAEEAEELRVGNKAAEEAEELPVTKKAAEEAEELPVAKKAAEETEELPVTKKAAEEAEELPVAKKAAEETEELK